MTTENTDAATRILTDAIRQLHELARAADEMDEARDTRERLTNECIVKARLTLIAADMPDWEVVLLSSETLQELAEKRMAELADERKTTAELRLLVASQANDLVLTRDRIVELETRITDAETELADAHGRIADMDDRIERALEALRNGLPARDILTEGFDS